MGEQTTNGYSTDRKMIEYRLDQTDEKLGHVEAAITTLAGDVRELKTTMTSNATNAGRWAGGIVSLLVTIIGGFVLWMLTGN